MATLNKLNKIQSLVATSHATKEEYERISAQINELKDMFDLGNVRLTGEQVIETVRQYYDLPEYYHVLKTRKREFVIARQMCAKILVDNTKFSLSQIGSFFGQNHDLIIYSKKAIENQIETNRKINIEHNELLSIIKSRIIEET